MDIDRLSLCSKILYDCRIIEHRHEIEHLKLRLFWYEYGYHALKRAMYRYNVNICKCQCIACAIAGRTLNYESWEDFPDLYEEQYDTCKFTEMLNGMLSHHGITWKRSYVGELDDEFQGVLWRVDPKRVETDIHLETREYGRWDLWRDWSIGKKLWGAKSVNDSEIKKYKLLVDHLNCVEEIVPKDVSIDPDITIL